MNANIEAGNHSVKLPYNLGESEIFFCTAPIEASPRPLFVRPNGELIFEKTAKEIANDLRARGNEYAKARCVPARCLISGREILDRQAVLATRRN